MNAEDLYQHIKDALRFLGLDFHQKEKMTVEFHHGSVSFSYGGKSITIKET